MMRMARVMEIFWLSLAVLSGCWVAYLLITSGWPENKLLVWFPLVCVAMWAYRRFTRKKMNEWMEREAQRSDRP